MKGIKLELLKRIVDSSIPIKKKPELADY